MGIKNYGLITSVAELRDIITTQVTGNVFGFDIETGYHGPDREKGAVHAETAILAGISFTSSTDWARYVPIGHNDAENLDALPTAQIIWDLLNTGLGVAHNAVFELRHLAKWFRETLADDPERGEAVRESDGYFPVRSDTQVEAYLAAEYQRFGLKYLVKELFDHQMTELFELFPDLAKNRRKFLRFNTLPLTAQVVEYACEDSAWCLAIHQRYYERVKPMLLFEVERGIVQHVVPPMEDVGVTYDWAMMRLTADRLRTFRDKFNAEIMTELSELAGQQVAVNLASPPQIADILFTKLGYRTTVYTDKTRDLPPEQRKMSTGAIALTKLSQQYPVVKKILQWKEMTRLLGTYLDKYEGLYNYADDGHAHPNHLSAVVITGRFAVADPPYQQCLPGSYEVLTPSGWVRLDELDDTTRVSQYHGDTQELEFVLPDEVVRNDFTGSMIRLDGRQIGSWVYTPNHRIVYRTRDRVNGGLSSVKEATAEEWKDSLIRSKRLGRMRVDRQHITAGFQHYGVELTEAERIDLRLAVAMQADGTCTNGHQYDIAVYRERKLAALRELGLDPQHQSRGRWRVRIPRARLERWLDDDENFKAEAILSLSHSDLQVFIDEIMKWDGTCGATYTQNNARAASVHVVQAAAVLCGYTASLYYWTEDDAVTLNLHDSVTMGSGWQEPSEKRHVGKVYCVTVPTGMFLCRNDQGKVMVTGNSPKKYHYDLAEARAAHEAGEQPPAGTCFTFNFRDCITVPQDHYGLGFDLSQAELRAIAGEAQETALLRAFELGEDVHRLTASLMLGIPLGEVTDEQRSVGKTMNFALLYGMGVKSLADRLGLALEEAQSLMDKYFAGFPAIAVWGARQIEKGKTQGYVTSRFGRRLPIWEYQSDKRWIYQKGDRACVNYPIQGAATGDYMKIAMVRAVAAIKKAGLSDKIRLVMNIHDALEFYVHTSVTPEQAVAVLRPAVVFAVPNWPAMKADWHLFKRWGSPMDIDITDDGRVVALDARAQELAPSVEIDEETGEAIEVLPEVDVDVVRSAARVGRPVLVSMAEMPTPQAWREFLAYVRDRPGSNRVTVRTPQGSMQLPAPSALGPEHDDEVSALLPGACVLLEL